MPEGAKLKVKRRPRAYARSAATVEQILNATLTVLTRDGYAALTLRGVAAECGLRAGNLSYHFPTKQVLLKGLLDAVLARYAESADRMEQAMDGDDRIRSVAALIYTLRDAQSFQASRLLPELWALANHDPEIEGWLQEFYRQARIPAIRRAQRLNPELSEEDAETVVIFFSSLVEGSTIFAGYEKPYADRMPDLAMLAVETLLHLIDTMTPDRLKALRAEWRHAPADRLWIPRSLMARSGPG